MDRKGKNGISLGVLIGGVNVNPFSSNPQFDSLEGIFSFVANALSWFVGFSAFVAVVMIIFGGFSIITAAGDPDKVNSGRNMIVAAVIGMIIVFVARMVVLFVLQNFLEQ